MLAVIRIKGEVHSPAKVRDTMRMLGLERVNHLALVVDSPTIRGMLKKVEHLVSFGEIDLKTLSLVLEKRGRLGGNKRLNAGFLQQHKFKSFNDLAEKILENKKIIVEMGVHPVFRLHPPRGGFERPGIKRSFSVGGVWGNRGPKINALIEKMS